MKQLLTIADATARIGKTIQWNAPAYKGNHPYRGIDTIISTTDEHKPINSDSILGDDLKYAFVNVYCNEDREAGLLCYSDGDRYVAYFDIDPLSDLFKIAIENKLFFKDENTLHVATSELTDLQRKSIKKAFPSVNIEDIKEKVSFDTWLVETRIYI